MRATSAVGKDRGAALVETALILTLLISVLVGTVTSAVTYGRSTSLQTAAREASRFAATLPVDGDLDAWLHDVLDVARAAAMGDLDAGVQGQYICVAYVFPDGTSADDQTMRLTEALGVTGTSQTASDCFADARPDDERRGQVMVQRESTIQAVFFSVDVTLSSPAVSRYER
ncbi:MAG: TadE/TadG family type IV pilus assembly protein [Acidimicrobiia bacterium]